MEILKEVTRFRNEFYHSQFNTPQLLKIVTNLRLDWGINEMSDSEKFDIGVTKPFILKGVSHSESKLKSNSKLYSYNESAQNLVNSFFVKKKLTIELIQEIHSNILQDGGQFRKQEVIVSDQTSVIETKFVDSLQIEERLLKLIDWFNKELNEATIHPVVLGTMLHYEFVRIHPFMDGNGRLARILTSLVLVSNGYLPPTSKFNNRQYYISALRSSDGGNIEPLIEFVAKRVIISYQRITEQNLRNYE
ncbi:Fic family protein [Flagellimonas pacifica]|uniref:Fic/DOC family protein n=1 Tax=Flagellimonas pacifica TaxID=1247520 RepID=A0A285MVK7_9FLAO|nr:Fic family protein [Allomuricauda parva]SNZ01229.1 Fic/DOC family protein [Allomuricauda parva]